MQRASASGVPSPKTPNTPNYPRTPLSASQSDSNPKSPPSKRRKLSPSPSTPVADQLDLSSSVTAALAERERTRVDALNRHVDQNVSDKESHWVLEYPGLKVEENMDVVDEVEIEEDEDETAIGRMTFGNFKRGRGKTEAENGDVAGQEEDIESEENKEDEDISASKVRKRKATPNAERDRTHESRAQKKLRKGIDPDKVNFGSLKGISGFKEKAGEFLRKKKKEQGREKYREKG
ncbi:MAG: hypothetical protein Q9227_009436 [Pyrenula ochraceoflavens]